MRPTFYLLAIVLSLCSSANAGIRECLDATCRVEVAGGMGTGTVFDQDENYVYILTNAHVAQGEGTPLRCVFVRDGFAQVVNGTTRWSVMEGQRDCAVGVIPVREFNGAVPKPIPFDPASVPSRGQTVMSVGCAQGANPTAWLGHVQAVSDWSIDFYPPPHRGRSGSAVFDADGTRILALVTWNGGGVGVAQQSRAVSAAFQRRFPNEVIPVCSGPSRGGRAPTGGFRPVAPLMPTESDCPECDRMSGGTPTRRVPIDELGPVAPLNPIPTSPAVTQPTCPTVDEDALVRRIELLIDAKIAALPKPVPGPSGPPGPAGPQGPAGPAGSDGANGSPGTAVEIDYDKLAEALARKNPSLTRDEVVAIVKEHCATKPDTDSTRPNPLPGYYEIRPKTKGAN